MPRKPNEAVAPRWVEAVNAPPDAADVATRRQVVTVAGVARSFLPTLTASERDVSAEPLGGALGAGHDDAEPMRACLEAAHRSGDVPPGDGAPVVDLGLLDAVDIDRGASLRRPGHGEPGDAGAAEGDGCRSALSAFDQVGAAVGLCRRDGSPAVAGGEAGLLLVRGRSERLGARDDAARSVRASDCQRVPLTWHQGRGVGDGHGPDRSGGTGHGCSGGVGACHGHRDRGSHSRHDAGGHAVGVSGEGRGAAAEESARRAHRYGGRRRGRSPGAGRRPGAARRQARSPSSCSC